MITKEEFVKQWKKSESDIKEIHFSGGYIIANDFVFMYSELNVVNLVHLIFIVDDRLISVGFIKLESILRVR